MSVSKIAELAGVSQATVSKVINHYPSVSAQCVARVRQVMKDMDYMPAPRKKRQGTASPAKVVALLLFPGGQFEEHRSNSARMLKGIQSALREKEMDLVVGYVERIGDLPVAVRRKQVSGLLLRGRMPDQRVMEALRGTPAIWLSSHQENSGHVLLEGNEAIGRMAAEYLVERGHRRIGVFNALGGNPVLGSRSDYFAFVAEHAGHPCVRLAADYGRDDGVGAEVDLEGLEREVELLIEKFMVLEPRPTGVFVPLDLQTALVYRALQRRGIRPGRDLDIISSDDEPAALLGLDPRPATINVGPEIMGQRAVRELCWRLEHQGVEDRVRVVVEPTLVPAEQEFSFTQAS